MIKQNKTPLFLSAEQAVPYIRDGANVVIDGFLLSCLAEEIVLAIEKSFAQTGHPRDISIVHAAGQGNAKGRGLDHLARPGIVRRSIGGHWNMIPGMQEAAKNNTLEAYNFPQGVIAHMIRDAAAKRPGTLTKTGLQTFIDPRLEGGRINACAKEDLVEVVNIHGEEYLLYAPLHVDVAILRGTVADMHGNLSFEEEPMLSTALQAAQAAHNNGGIVIAQVKRVQRDVLLSPWRINVPGVYVDIVVPVSDEKLHMQAEGYVFDPALCGTEPGGMLDGIVFAPMALDARKIIARRAIRELKPGAIANLGVGMPEGIANIAAEQGRLDDFTLTIESGLIGGLPLSGMAFGCARNFEAVVDAPTIFDFYQGGGLDITFLGLAQVDGRGNVNVSRFGPRIAGCGGFIDITQHTKHVVFCGTFTAKGLAVSCADGKLVIEHEGEMKKFCREVEQITFSGDYAAEHDKDVLFITERAVLKLTKQGLELVEYAPGVDIERDIVGQMETKPIIKTPVLMDEELFLP